MLWAAFAAAAAVDWWAVASGRAKIEQFFKPLTLAILIVVAVTATFDPASVKPYLVAGLAFGLLGDVLLLRVINRFKAGLVAFLMGHVAYIVALTAALVAHDAGSTRWLVAAVVAVVALLTFGRLPQLFAGINSHHPKLRLPVTVYSAVIVAMVGLAVARGQPLTAGGAILFACSDRLLAEDRFVRPLPKTRWLVHLSYHLGQAAIVAGLIA